MACVYTTSCNGSATALGAFHDGRESGMGCTLARVGLDDQPGCEGRGGYYCMRLNLSAGNP